MSTAANKLQESLSSVVTGLGYELLGVEWIAQGKHSLLRLYIDHENGIVIEDCERVSHQVSAFLDVEDLIKGHYRLEVSSPGIDRPLFTLAHYQRFLGEQVNIKCHSPINGQRRFRGKLAAVSTEKEEINLHLEDGSEVILPLSAVAKANLVAQL